MEENLGWSQGKAKVGIDALDNIRSVDIDRHSITGESILLLLLFFFLSLSHEAFFYSSFFLGVMFLFGEPKRSSTAAVAPKMNATILSLPSLWFRLTFSLHDRSTRR